jgi:protein SCO1/2
MKNKSYIGISFIILVFGILVVPKIVERIQNGSVTSADRLDKVQIGNVEDTSLVKIGPCPNFELISQDNATVSNATFNGKVFVLEFFFTSCPTICPKMNQSMLGIEKQFFGNPNFGIASISIDPITDSPKVLKEHAEALGVKSSNWYFLTGDKDYIFNLANKGFNLYAGENSKVSGGFEHSGLFALIDKDGIIRCRRDQYGNPILYYDGLEAKGVKDIQEDIKKLLKE